MMAARAWRLVWTMALGVFLPVLAGGAAPADLKALLPKVQTAMRAGKFAEAQDLLSAAMVEEPGNPQLFFVRGQVYDASHDYAMALAAFSEVIRFDPRVIDAYQKRGTDHFRLGHFNEAITDWDKVIKMRPEQGPYHWQRGIALYYAGRYADGRKQFESHQTVNPNDVENAVWHFLCVTRESGLEKARAALIPISGDSRIPMMEVHSLFAGKLKPEDVVAAAKKGEPAPEDLKHRMFYANLYLGLYFEATGDTKLARENIFKAAEVAEADDYMGDVAKVHAEVLRKKQKEMDSKHVQAH